MAFTSIQWQHHNYNYQGASKPVSATSAAFTETRLARSPFSISREFGLFCLMVTSSARSAKNGCKMVGSLRLACFKSAMDLYCVGQVPTDQTVRQSLSIEPFGSSAVPWSQTKRPCQSLNSVEDCSYGDSSLDQAPQIQHLFGTYVSGKPGGIAGGSALGQADSPIAACDPACEVICATSTSYVTQSLNQQLIFGKNCIPK